MIGDSLTDEAKAFIRHNYCQYGAKWCANKLKDASYSTIKRWANKQGLYHQFRRHVERVADMHVADAELEALNRRAWR